MQRSVWKIPYISPIFFSKKFFKSKKFFTKIRHTSISPKFFGKKIGVYSGNTPKTIFIRKYFLGIKLVNIA